MPSARATCHRSIRLATLIAAGGFIACTASGPAGPTERMHAFGPSDRPITQTGVIADADGWRIARDGAGSVRLFEVDNLGVEQVKLTYRARLKAADIKGRAYLEMWVRVPGFGEAFSRGLDQPIQGTTDWATYEIPFFLKKGERADLVKLNVAFEGGGGTIWIKDLELLKTPMAG